MKLRLLVGIFLIFCNCSFAYTATSSQPVKHTFNVNYDHHGLMVVRDDGKYSFNLYGFIEADFLKFAGSDGLLRSGTNIRYSNLYLMGTAASVWQYFLSYSVNLSELLDASIIYYGFPNQIIQIGQFTPNIGFSNWSKHTDLNFLEWPLPVLAFSPLYPQGANYTIFGKYLMANVSLFSGSTLESYTGTNPVGGTGRLVFSPIHIPRRLLHLGLSNWWQRPNNTHMVLFATPPEAASQGNDTLINTGIITDVNYYNILSGEFATVYGPLSLQAEYYINDVKRYHGLQTLNFSGYYATIGYFLTGESMNYSYPLCAFVPLEKINHSYGAWQVLLRYSALNLNSHQIQGGKEYNLTAGLNWFANHFITFQLNIIQAIARPAFTGKDVNSTIYALRAQVVF